MSTIVGYIASNSNITFVGSTGSVYRVRIDQLFNRQMAKELSIHGMYASVYNNDTGFFQTDHIREVICSGCHPIYQVTVENGKHLYCSANQKFLTKLGWQTLGQAVGLKTNADSAVIGVTRECSVMARGFIVPEVAPRYSPTIYPLKVTGIKLLGFGETYTLKFLHNSNNFVANDLVVHV